MRRLALKSETRPGILRRVWTKLTEPGAERYAPFVELRTYGRASTSTATRRTRKTKEDNCPHNPMPLHGPMAGPLFHS